MLLAFVNNRVKEMRSHVKELEEEIAQMVDVTESARKERTAQEQQYQHQREALERKLSGANEEIVGLRNELELYRDYDEVKRELEILKVSLYTSHHDTRAHELNCRLQYIEFASGDHADADSLHSMQLPNPKANRIDARAGGSLEALFAQKNKKLQEENARLRVSIHRQTPTPRFSNSSS